MEDGILTGTFAAGLQKGLAAEAARRRIPAPPLKTKKVVEHGILTGAFAARLQKGLAAEAARWRIPAPPLKTNSESGRVAERLKAHAWKVC